MVAYPPVWFLVSVSVWLFLALGLLYLSLKWIFFLLFLISLTSFLCFSNSIYVIIWCFVSLMCFGHFQIVCYNFGLFFEQVFLGYFTVELAEYYFCYTFMWELITVLFCCLNLSKFEFSKFLREGFVQIVF